MRRHFQWDLGRRSLPLGERTLVMGILNVTPDSFSDGGRYFDPPAAIAHGLSLLDQGADILDIGGESTRPGAAIDSPLSAPSPGREAAVSAQEEIDRVLPVLEAIRRERPEAVFSIDTYKSAVARCALDAGAEIINDVSGLTWDAEISAIIAERRCGVVLMHSRGLPHQWSSLPAAPNIFSLVFNGLADRAAAALLSRIPRRCIVLDPGFGFGKRLDENYSLLSRFAELAEIGFPLLAGVSRKRFLAHTLAERMAQLSANRAAPSAEHSAASDAAPDTTSNAALNGTLTGTLAASVAAALAGAHIVRVHAVRPAVEALAIADAILRAQG